MGLIYVDALQSDPWRNSPLTTEVFKCVTKCPDCGGIMLDDGLVYLSNPPQYKYICERCGKAMWSSELFNH